MKIDKIQDRLIEEFALLKEWFDKYEHLIELGKQLPLLDEKYKTEENLISGCQSRLWITAELVDGKIVFHADSDAKITRGIIAVVLKVVNNQPPEEVAKVELYCLDAIGLTSNLSPSRANGLASIIKRIYDLANIFVEQDSF